MLRETDASERRTHDKPRTPRRPGHPVAEAGGEPPREETVWLSNGRGPEPYDIDWME